MSNQLSNLEIQLIRSSMATKTNEEIAELIERPVGEVVEFIDQITGGGASARTQRIIDAKSAIARMEEEKRKGKAKFKERVQRKKVENDYEILERHKRDSATAIADHQKMLTRLRESRQTFKTRVTDYSKMKTVKVCKGTYVWVPLEADPAEVIRKYNQNRENQRDAALEKDIKNLNQ